MRTTIGIFFFITVVFDFAEKDLFSEAILLFVETMTPESINLSATFTALSSKPPGLLRKSMISPL